MITQHGPPMVKPVLVSAIFFRRCQPHLAMRRKKSPAPPLSLRFQVSGEKEAIVKFISTFPPARTWSLSVTTRLAKKIRSGLGAQPKAYELISLQQLADSGVQGDGRRIDAQDAVSERNQAAALIGQGGDFRVEPAAFRADKEQIASAGFYQAAE